MISKRATASPGDLNSGTTAVRDGFALDEVALDSWLRAHVPDYHGPLHVEQFKGGQSNPTYKLVTPRRSYVLRRKPTGPLLKGAHAIEREAHVLHALRLTDVPVPHVYGVCTDDDVLGSWFYVMDMVEGRIFWDNTIPDVSTRERVRLFDAMNATIAAIHRVDPTAIGLADYGRAGNYFERQIGRWTDQYLSDEAAGRDPNMDRLVEWLRGRLPVADEIALVHGDYRIDNLIFHPTEPRVVAVLDWELSTLGHPGSDYAYHAMMYRMPPHIVAGLGDADVAALGIPDERAYLSDYCERVGRTSMPEYDFYLAFNMFRLAAIFHGIKGRVLRGTASSAQSKTRSELFPELAALAWEQASRLA